MSSVTEKVCKLKFEQRSSVWAASNIAWECSFLVRRFLPRFKLTFGFGLKNISPLMCRYYSSLRMILFNFLLSLIFVTGALSFFAAAVSCMECWIWAHSSMISILRLDCSGRQWCYNWLQFMAVLLWFVVRRTLLVADYLVYWFLRKSLLRHRFTLAETDISRRKGRFQAQGIVKRGRKKSPFIDSYVALSEIFRRPTNFICRVSNCNHIGVIRIGWGVSNCWVCVVQNQR